MVNESKEASLLGGRSGTKVVRVGSTVRRLMGPRSDFNHALLKLLEEKGFNGAPRFFGIDEKGREILSFIEGEVPHREVSWTFDQLVKIVQMIRDFHNATAGSMLAGNKEVVCHGDIAPWNTVIKDNIPIAFIDFDDPEPGNRVDDVAYFLWTFLELGNGVSAYEQAEIIRKLCDVYGFSDGKKLITAVLGQQEKILTMREVLAKNELSQDDRGFSRSRAVRIRSEIEWVKANRNVLESVF